MVILILLVPLLAAFAVNVAGWIDRRWCHPLAVGATGFSLYASVRILSAVVATGPIEYRLGGWAPPVGIEFVIDHLNAMMLTVIAFVSFLVSIYAGEAANRELPKKIPQFHALLLLSVTGLLGMTITGDVFNLYVLLEISALTTYALIALGEDRALLSSFNYVILGTIGACFYLLGVGHLYIMTGSLNMGDLSRILPSLHGAGAIHVAFVLILAGLWVKMAFFPLHSWLPNAYTYAPSATTCLIAPLTTKVGVYIMVRLMFSVFSTEFAFGDFAGRQVVPHLAVLAIVAGSFLAVAQRDFKKMLTYLIVAEVGYMVGGVWLANSHGITGAILHIMNDALMTLCLFLAAGIIVYKTGGHGFENLQALYRRMPLTMGAFTVGAVSMIGVPPTAGFFSKWYLILGGIEAGQWGFVGALLFSSLMNVVLFFKVIEIGYFEPAGDHHHGHGHAEEHDGIDEAPLSMLAPLMVVAVALVVVGLNAGAIVTKVVQHAVPAGL